MTYAGTQRQRSEERRVSPVFWVLLAVLGTSSWAVWTGYGENARFGVFLFVVSGWVVSLCLHEYAHARTALHGGDLTVGAKGYLTLNPLKYANTLLSVILPVVFVILGGIGLPGGAVFIERHRISGRWKHSLISAAGPLVNLALAVALLLPIGAGWLDSAPPTFVVALAFLAMLQVTATVLNLIPVPGFDGYGIIEPWLSLKARRAVEPFAPFGMLALFALLWQTPLGDWFWKLVYRVMELLDVSPSLAAIGYHAFRFWEG
ncbi:site-2 protease family protein [Peterkaempfera bronchialis]|uniref:Site-2 protease family protein n=1 Tax=Peterkaempfera bronchialis TaxID=2126346 RepID=A0A345SU26_9ACTN|nr:site-2 protease family protein [Peterkaempfera bronchialis]AXI77231.1 site-2 protease family protein [Peterkaempfera bronchialis]